MAQLETIQPILESMGEDSEQSRLAALKKLFWTELNYEQGGQVLPDANWTADQVWVAGMGDNSKYLAQGA